MSGRWRGVPAAVWLLVLLNLGLLAGYAVLVPTWRAPDEPQHTDLVFAVRDGGGWPGRGERRLTARIIRSYDNAQFDFEGRRTEPRLEASRAVPRGERPTFAEIAPDDNIGSRNGQFQHPPLYYLTVATAFTFVSSLVPGAEGWSYDVVLVVLRLVGALLVAPLPLLAYLTARRVGARETVAVAAAAVPLAVPGLTHIGAAVNPDALLIPAVGVLTVLLAGVARGDLRRRTALTVGVATGVALLSKGLALFTPAMVIAAYWLGAAAPDPTWRKSAAVDRRWRAAAMVRVVQAGAVSFICGGWWWLRNLIVHGAIQPTGAAIPPAPEGFTPSPIEWLGAVVSLIPPRWWGSFGWYQAELPPALAWVATAAVAVAVIAAFALRRSGAPPRRQLALLLVPLAGTLGIVAVGAWGYYAESSLTPGLQGRYLYAGVVGLAVVVACGLGRLVGGRDRRLGLAVLGAAAVLQVVAVLVIATRWYGIPGVRSPAATLAGFLAWSPLGRLGLSCIVALVAVGGIGALVALMGPPRLLSPPSARAGGRRARRRAADPAPGR